MSILRHRAEPWTPYWRSLLAQDSGWQSWSSTAPSGSDKPTASLLVAWPTTVACGRTRPDRPRRHDSLQHLSCWSGHTAPAASRERSAQLRERPTVTRDVDRQDNSRQCIGLAKLGTALPTTLRCSRRGASSDSARNLSRDLAPHQSAVHVEHSTQPRKEPDVTRIRERHNRRNGTTATSKHR
jgi:hypothetical protein